MEPSAPTPCQWLAILHLLALDLFSLLYTVTPSLPFSQDSGFWEVLAFLLLLFQASYIFQVQLLDSDFVSQAKDHLAIYMSKGVTGTSGHSSQQAADPEIC